MKDEIIPDIQNNNAAKKEWTQAMEKWRLPYWDWAIPQVDYGKGQEKLGVPKIVDDSKVWILKLGGHDKEEIPNPLYKFSNKINSQDVRVGDETKMKGFVMNWNNNKYNNWIGTSRYGDPTQKTWEQGVENNAKVTEAFGKHDWKQQGAKSIAHEVFRILTENYFQSYGTFSSTRYYNQIQPKPKEWSSLEQIHNKIHVRSLCVGRAGVSKLTKPALDRGNGCIGGPYGAGPCLSI
jgi:tyrosinase